jgi:hypothetical protein
MPPPRNTTILLVGEKTILAPIIPFVFQQLFIMIWTLNLVEMFHDIIFYHYLLLVDKSIEIIQNKNITKPQYYQT